MGEKEAEEQAAREDVLAYAEAIAYFETHDLGDELAEMPDIHFEVGLPPRQMLDGSKVASGQHERQ